LFFPSNENPAAISSLRAVQRLYIEVMNAPIPPDTDPESNPMADSWKPADKALEAAIENPEEFDINRRATEDSVGPVPSGKPKTHGEAESRSSVRRKSDSCRA
jgi:hypothetical protein